MSRDATFHPLLRCRLLDGKRGAPDAGILFARRSVVLRLRCLFQHARCCHALSSWGGQILRGSASPDPWAQPEIGVDPAFLPVYAAHVDERFRRAFEHCVPPADSAGPWIPLSCELIQEGALKFWLSGTPHSVYAGLHPLISFDAARVLYVTLNTGVQLSVYG